MLRHVDLVKTDVSEERIATIIRLTSIGELGTRLAVTSNGSTLRGKTLKSRFLQEPHGVTSQKTAVFIVTAVKNSILTISGIIPHYDSDLFLTFTKYLYCGDRNILREEIALTFFCVSQRSKKLYGQKQYHVWQVICQWQMYLKYKSCI
jgi:hypothetical protein